MPSPQGSQERGLESKQHGLRGMWSTCSKPRVHDLRSRRLLRVCSRPRAGTLAFERASTYTRASDFGALVHLVLRLQCVLDLTALRFFQHSVCPLKQSFKCVADGSHPKNFNAVVVIKPR